MGEAYSISFRVNHPSQNLADFCKQVGVQPDRIWTIGERRRTPKGTELEGFYDASYCSIEIASEKHGQLADGLTSFIVAYRQHEAPLRELTASGGSLSLFVGWFLDKNVGDVLDWKLLRDLADLQVSLELNVYC